MSGIALGTVLPSGSAAAETQQYADEKASARLTPEPLVASNGGTESLNGTWDFALSTSETPPSTSARRVTPDRSGTGNDGTLLNDPPVITDLSDQALDLTGDRYVGVGDADSLDFTSPGFTIQITFKYEGDGPLYSKGGDQYSLGVWGGTLSFWMRGGGDWPGINAGDLSQGRWYTTTLVVDEKEIRLYLDGDEIGATGHGFSSFSSTDSPVHLGYNSKNGNYGSPVADSFRAFDTALTPEQVGREFGSVPDSAVAWLSMDSVSNGTTPDESGAGNDGTLHNGPTLVPGREGRGVDLAGNGAVRIANDASLNRTAPGFTLQTTVKYNGGGGVVVDRGKTASGTEQFGLGIYDGGVSFWMQTDGGNWPGVSGGSLTTGNWHTITVVVGAAELVLYVDGSEVATASHDASALASSDAPLLVGGNDLDHSAKTTALLGTALSTSQVSSGFRGVPDSAVLWLDYNTINDRTVDWSESDVPGQWAYDGYYVPSGAADWYPANDALGWYRRQFEVPDDWDGSRLLLRFDAVYSEASVFVNGTKVGNHVGGYTPFEVDVTDAVTVEGANTLAVGVSQSSPADDMGWQNVTGGITRDVTLYGVPEVHVADCDVRTDLAADGSSATVSVDTDVTNAGLSAAASASVTATLTNPDGQTIATATQGVSTIGAGSTQTLSVEFDVSDPQPWSPDRPQLYTVDVTLDADGQTEQISERIGIRDVTVQGNELQINGQAVTLRGMNWEEIHLPKHGHAVPPEITREDARRLKEANVNYVRTAHHPTSEAFLDACDEFGIVVEMEAPHMFIGRDRGDPYPDVVVQQTLEMVERDKNRASVCLWSIANESEWYDVFDTVGALVKEVDPTRPTIFNHDDYDPSDPWHDDYDVRADHYPALRSGSTIEEHTGLSDPLLFDEFAHTYCYNDRELVTDPGLRDEWGLVFEHVWEQCRTAESVAGAAIWAGGDHLEMWGEYLWGMLDRNRRPRPEYWHVKKVYSPVAIDAEWQGNGNVVKLTIENRYEFVDLAEREFTFDGTPRTGTISVDIPPGERETLTIPVKGDNLDVTVTHPFGHTIDRYSFAPDESAAKLPSEPADGSFTSSDGTLSVTTDTLSLDVDERSGAVELRSADGSVLLVDGPELAITPTQQTAGRDYETAIDHRPSGRTVTDVSLVEDGAAVAITVGYDVAEGTFTLRPLAGGLDVEYDFTLTQAVDAREAGLALPAATDLTTLSWDRDAQWSTYPDSHVGRESGTATAFPNGSRPDHEEIRIQTGQPWKDDATSHGSNDFRSVKRNVREAALSDGAGSGLTILSDGRQHVRATVRSGAVDALVLERSISGTNAYGWMNRQPVMDQNPTLAEGTRLQNTVTLQPSDASDAADQ